MVGTFEANLEHAKLMTDRDHRSPGKSFAEYIESHSDDLTEVRRPEDTCHESDHADLYSFKCTRHIPPGLSRGLLTGS